MNEWVEQKIDLGPKLGYLKRIYRLTRLADKIPYFMIIGQRHY